MSASTLFACIAVVVCAGLPRAASAGQAADREPLPARAIDLPLSTPVPSARVVLVSLSQIEELEAWTRAVVEWQKQTELFLNRRQPGKWAYAVDRAPKPEPPAWLPGACELLADDPAFTKPCTLLVQWREDPIATKTRQTAAAIVKQQEAPTKSLWWQHVQLDGLYSTTRSDMSAFGLFGTHLTMDVEGRFQIFIAPGILLVSVPGFSGQRELWPATDYGVTYRLFNAGRSVVHFNLVHAWLFGGKGAVVSPTMTLAGFSLSFKPRPH